MSPLALSHSRSSSIILVCVAQTTPRIRTRCVRLTRPGVACGGAHQQQLQHITRPLPSPLRASSSMIEPAANLPTRGRTRLRPARCSSLFVVAGDSLLLLHGDLARGSAGCPNPPPRTCSVHITYTVHPVARIQRPHSEVHVHLLTVGRRVTRSDNRSVRRVLWALPLHLLAAVARLCLMRGRLHTEGGARLWGRYCVALAMG